MGDEPLAGRSDSDREATVLRRRLKRERAIRREAERIAERVTARWYEADQVKSALIDTVAHELRTPLTAVMGFADVLGERWELLSDEQRRHTVALVQENAHALAKLVDAILDYDRLDKGAVTLTLEPVDVGDALSQLVARLSGSFDIHTLTVEDCEIGTVLADRMALDRVVTNLLDNARKYSPDASVITAGAWAEDRFGVITVDDQGVGIPADEREKVFEPFYRCERDKALAVRGTGLGLPIVRHLVESMNGAVALADSPSGGTRVEVRLPRA